jgi:hypothetical protein
MRFKKLRFVVGIAILLFILVIGNIIALGYFHNSQQNQTVAAIDTKQVSSLNY